MDTLILSPYPERLIPAFPKAEADQTVYWCDQLREHDVPEVDWIISYGYRKIIRRGFLDKFTGEILNIHIGLLPWNRGADPNFWSWFDDTPKGITIHQLDKGIDTGPIYYQTEVQFSLNKYNTLATTYEGLHVAAIESFAQIWPQIRDGSLKPVPQTGIGTLHKKADLQPFFGLLSAGYDTPVIEVQTWGKLYRARQQKAQVHSGDRHGINRPSSLP